MLLTKDSSTMLAHLQRKQGLADKIHFTQRVGVAPGTTTMCLDCPPKELAGMLPAQGGDNDMHTLGGACPPDPTNQYMVDKWRPSARALPAPAPAAVLPRSKALDVYASEAELKGPPFGGSWLGFGAVVTGALLAAAGAAHVLRRKS